MFEGFLVAVDRLLSAPTRFDEVDVDVDDCLLEPGVEVGAKGVRWALPVGMR